MALDFWGRGHTTISTNQRMRNHFHTELIQSDYRHMKDSDHFQEVLSSTVCFLSKVPDKNNR